jgi:hypothetical protein
MVPIESKRPTIAETPVQRWQIFWNLQPTTANGMVRPCSGPASTRSWPGALKSRSTPCLRNSMQQSP